MTGNEIHPYHEILYCMDGEVTFLSERFQEKLSGPTLLLIPKECYHQFCIGNQNTYTRLVITFPDISDIDDLISFSMTDIQIVSKPNAQLEYLLQKMCQITCCDNPAEEHRVFLYGAFFMLLAELKLGKVELISPRLREKDQLITKCIQYIDVHFIENLSAEMLAKEMNVAVSTLFHCFKKELGISLYRYIIEKRLIYAHKRISEGNRPTKVYLECGYHDYPTFYKAYVKMFGNTPSGEKKIR